MPASTDSQSEERSCSRSTVPDVPFDGLDSPSSYPEVKEQPWKKYIKTPEIKPMCENSDPLMRMKREKNAPDGLGG
jgi:hypothetical protein